MTSANTNTEILSFAQNDDCLIQHDGRLGQDEESLISATVGLQPVYNERLAGGKMRRWIRCAWKRLLSAVLVISLGWANGTSLGQKVPEKEVGSITGVVMDPSGAVVPGASVMLLSTQMPASVLSTTASGEMGRYRLRATAGMYNVVVEAAGFARFESGPFRVGETSGLGETFGAERTLDIALKLETRVEKIEVPDELGGNSNADGGTQVLASHAIEQMPRDPTALLDELRGLAGGPNAELYVSGFSGGKLPPRGNIGEIRIKRNAYSAENDTDPGNGVIQISTKPGTDQLHGEFYLYGNDSALNAGNPFAPDQPGYYADGSGGSMSGPISPKASYFAGWDQMQLEMNSAIDAQTLDANDEPTQVCYAVRSPRSSVNASTRADLRSGTNGTMIVRYAVDREAQGNGGIGQLALASQGFSNDTVTQTLQIANTQPTI